MNMLKQRHGILRLLLTRKKLRKACNFNKFIATLHQ